MRSDASDTAGSAPGILVTSTRGLRLEDNHLEHHGLNSDVAHLLRDAGEPPDTPIARIQCEP
jgi:hypothetical protein